MCGCEEIVYVQIGLQRRLVHYKWGHWGRRRCGERGRSEQGRTLLLFDSPETLIRAPYCGMQGESGVYTGQWVCSALDTGRKSKK